MTHQTHIPTGTSRGVPRQAGPGHMTDLRIAFGHSPTNRHRTATRLHWACTYAIILGAMAAAGGIIGAVLWLGVAGAALMTGAGIVAVASGILENTEEYPAPRSAEGRPR